MFRLGRKRSTAIRGFAGLGIVLMLSVLYRPAFAIASAPGAGGGEPPPQAAQPASQTAARRDTASAPAGRVRSSIVPIALRSEQQKGDDPWRLFDGDGATTFRFAGTARVRASLPAGTTLESVGVYGAANATLTVYADSPSGPQPVQGLDKVALADLALRWNRADAAAAAPVSELILELAAPPGESAEVRELEIWGGAPLTPPRDLTSSTAAAELLLTDLPPGAVNAAGTPAEAAISAPTLGQDGAATFRIDLNRSGRMFDRAFLVYDLEGLAHWSAVPRRINGQAVQGGFGATHAARGGRQVEEISPDWLRAGPNEVAFLVANHDDPRGYKVKNVRIVGMPAAANATAFVPSVAAAATPAAAALLDGNTETGVAGKDLHRRRLSFTLAFDGPSQPDSLLVAVEKGAEGAISARPIVRGKPAGRETVANLAELTPGWNRLRLDDTTAEAQAVRITLSAGAESTAAALVSELRVTGSRRPARATSNLVIAYPLHGECVDGQAYVRGFLRGGGDAGTKGAVLRVDGAARPSALAVDGGFSAVVAPPSAAARRGGKWQVEVEASFANGDTTGGVIDVDGCREPEPVSEGGPREDEGAPYGQWVRAGQAATLSFAGAKLEIPEGALEKDTRITVRPIDGIEVPATDETLTNVTPGGRAYRLGPHGLKFLKPVALTVPYDRARFVGGQAEDDVGVFFFDEDAKRWSQVQTIRGDAGARTLVAATGHFTDFISATISSPDHPTADSFNPNSIKDMKVGDPAAEIDLIAPPEPSPDGAAHVSFPLWLPSGRQGMQPQLTATYSSDAGNGILGVGWDLGISSIQVDTRFGVPRYDQSVETETYMLDGELLIMDAGQQARGQQTRFHRRSEGKFDTILRNAFAPGAGPLESVAGDNATYTWEVIDKRGVHYFYGENFDARGSATGRGVWRWNLSRMEDAFGNQIIYTYDKRVTGFHGNSAVPAVEVYPKQIDYTADSAGNNPTYRILFEMDDGTVTDNPTPDHNPRPDPFSNARGGTIALTAHRLVNVRLFRAGQEGDKFNAIRRYNFQYETGRFNKSLLNVLRVVIGQPTGEITLGDSPIEFYRHTFNYSDLIVPDGQAVTFGQPQVWGQVDDDQELSAVSSESLNGTAMIGAGPGGCELFHVAAGGAASLDIPIPLPDFIPHDNQDRTIGEFVDINGDGLPDFIGKGGEFQSGGFLEGSSKVFLNGGDALLNSGNQMTFLTGNGFSLPSDPLGHGSNFSVSVTAGAHELFEAAHQSFEHTWASASEDRTLADVDGDGFVDYLVSNGSFSLNHGAGFSVPASWGVPSVSIGIPQGVIDDQKKNFTLADPVMLWTAPYPGHVLITGAAQKAPNTQTTDDGVALTILSFTPGGSSPTSQWSTVLSDTTPCAPIEAPATSGCGSGRTILVKAGDRIYFRVDSRDDIQNDTVAWDPVLSYQDICDAAGGNCQSLAAGQHAVNEPFNTGVFDFDQSKDFRLAGKPIPLWRSDAVGDAESPGTVTIQISGDITKQPTSDTVTVQVFKIPSGSTTPTPAGLAGFPKTLTPDSQGPVPLGSPAPTLQVNPGDRLFFQVSSPTPIDPKQVSWPVHVDYLSFCRADSVPAGSADFSQATNVCGAVNCPAASGASCTIANDPDPVANPLSASVIHQDVPAYYQQAPWTQFVSPGTSVGFVAQSAGEVTFTSQYVGPGSRLVVRRSNQTSPPASALVFDTPVNASPRLGSVPVQGGPIAVAAGDSLVFDVFNVVNPPLADVASWNVSLQFDGGTAQAITARRDVQLVNADLDSGRFHAWTFFEWNGSNGVGNNGFDSTVQTGLTAPPPTNGQQPNVRVMAEAPQGIPPGTAANPQPGIPGPLWRGGGVDDYIAAGALKPSRLGRIKSGGVPVAFSATSNETNAAGVGLIFSITPSDGTSSTQVQLVDMNGDRFPDIVTNDGVYFNSVSNSGQTDATGSFGALQSFSATGAALSGNLRDAASNQIAASLGISSPVSVAYKGKPPKWASLLPAVGVGYGDVTTTSELVDINGDGLPDHIVRDPATGDFNVQMNLGYSLSAPVPYAGSDSNGGFGAVTAAPSFGGQNLATGIGGDFQSAANGKVGALPNAVQKQDNAMNNVGAGYSYFGGNRTASVTRTVVDMVDINGDGLPDIVQRGHKSGTMFIWFNTGDGFAHQEPWHVPDWNVGVEQSATVGLGSNDALGFTESLGLSFSAGYSAYFETLVAGCYGFEIGAGAGKTTTGSSMRLQDIDGDGAPDFVLKLANDSNVYVRRNPASGFETPNGTTPSHQSNGVNLLTGIHNPLGGFTALSYERVGHVIGSVTDSSGQHVTVDMPDHQFVLQKVEVQDGLNFVAVPDHQVLTTTINYRVDPTQVVSGFYSRADREFFGYSRLAFIRGTGQSDFQSVSRVYDNSTYERKHLLLSEIIRDQPVTGGSTTSLFRKTLRTFDSRSVTAAPGSIFPALTSERTFFYEGLTNNENAPVKSTTRGYDYDTQGNQTKFDDLGDDDSAVTKDDVHYSIGYQFIADPIDGGSGAQLARANDVKARDAGGNLLRERTSVYGSHGEMQSLTDVLFGGKDPTTGQAYTPTNNTGIAWSFPSYDQFGNLQTAIDPAGLSLSYTYDPDAHAHIASITDGLGYKSFRTFDARFGKLRDTTDVNGQVQHLDYDDFGRIVNVCAPVDVVAVSNGNFACASQPTVAVDYAIANNVTKGNLGGVPFWARAHHKDVTQVGVSADTTIDTVVFVDGLKRVRQSKKDATVNTTVGRIVSGQVAYDDKGRLFQEGFPAFETDASSQQTTFSPIPLGRAAKTFAYDVMDRERAITTPDNKGTSTDPQGQAAVTTLIDYNAKALDGRTQLVKTTQDPQGKLRTVYLSPRSEVLAISEVNRIGAAFPNGTSTVLTTRYTDDPLSQLVQVQDPNGNLTTATFDSLGHVVKLVSQDAGQTEWRYDTAGRLAVKETANLRANAQLIKYGYEFDRIKTVTYPKTAQVTYTYGDADHAGAANGNIAGRVSQVTDESGVETRTYDSLGNVAHMEKTPATQLPSIPGVTYKMDYAYDTLGRVLSMNYPDGETIKYGYDAAGLATSVIGTRNGASTTYVTNVGYNELGQRATMLFGNGVVSEYQYLPDTKRLQNVATVSPKVNTNLQSLSFTYDLVGNVTGLKNFLLPPQPVPPNTVIAPGPNTQSFTYDDLYQLTSASGLYQGCACGCANDRQYTMTLQYDGLGNVTHKTQNDVIEAPAGSGQLTKQVATTYDNSYTYGGPRPHAPTGIGPQTLAYDGDGNTLTAAGSFGPSRTFNWTEEDRLRSETDSGFTSTFLYDASGIRSHKRRNTLETWYVNPFYVVKNSLTETKHVMMGNDRVASAVATLSNRADPKTAGNATVFFYHPDHLQSTHFTTGADGSLLQHDEYFPSGEVWFQEQKNNDSRNAQPWLFNAKELDETGLYYFGARYYNPKYSVWSNPDPILSNNMLRGANGASPANMGLYSYANNNPVVLRDPDGRQTATIGPQTGGHHMTLKEFLGISDAQQQIGKDIAKGGIATGIAFEIGRKVTDDPRRIQGLTGATSNASNLATLGAAGLLARPTGGGEETGRPPTVVTIDATTGKVTVSNSGPVVFVPPPGATQDEIAQVQQYCDGCNTALASGALSPTGRVSTTGELRRQASQAARAERSRADEAGTPYLGQAGHMPDTTWTGQPEPPFWIDLSPKVNSSLGGQAKNYPLGYQPTIFIFSPRK